MEFGGASSLVLLLAVALWLAYVIPSLVRRHNYLATERNAVRLQQTLRVLAETAETPAELRVETTSRSVAEQQRRLKQARREAEQAERARIAAAERNLPAVPLPRSEADGRRAAAATRRGRLLTTFVGVVGLVGVGVGTWLGVTTAMWWGLVAGVVVVLGAVAMLQRLARVAAAQRLAAERRAADTARTTHAPATQPTPHAHPLADWNDDRVAANAAPPAAIDAVAPGWTPIAVPKPLYLLRDAAGDEANASGGPGRPDGPDGGTRPAAFDIEMLREAARRSEQAIRDAHAQDGVATFGRVASADSTPVGAAVAASEADTQPIMHAAIADAVRLEPIEASGPAHGAASKWARMGVLDDADAGSHELVSRRRRAG